MKALSQATLTEFARAGAVRGRPDGYVLSVHYETVLTAKRSGARRFARIDTALALLRTLRAAGRRAPGRHRAAPVHLPPRASRRPGRPRPAARRGHDAAVGRAARP